MPPRPAGLRENRRPLSAIFIGSSAAAAAGHAPSTAPLPDLPEPPSPSGSSVRSGLPSPPATNSTGGSSTGDPATIALRRPMSARTTTPSPGNSRSSSRLSADDDEQTMRLRIAGGSANESILQRARSLQQRNRIQLDKFARHSMPPDPVQPLSGSETEREGDSAVFHSTSSTSSRPSKVRLASAPSSPHKTRGSANSGTPRRKRVSLASNNILDDDDSSDREHDYNNDERMAKDRERYQDQERYQVGAARDRIRDILREDRPSPRSPALSLTKSPITTARRRSALPREFLESSADEPPTDLQTPLRPTATTSAPSSSNMSTTTSRRAALRGSRLSDDYRPSSLSYSSRDSRAHTPPINTLSTLATPPSPATAPTTPASTKSSHSTSDSYSNSPTILARSNTIGRQMQKERRQSLRGGSAESALGAGRSLVGEGLRAAGLSRRSVGATGTLRERERERNSESILIRERELERLSMASRSTNRSRHVSIDFRPSKSPEREEPLARHMHRRALPAEYGELGSRALPPRASTSMANYSYTSQSKMSAVDSEDSEEEEVGSRSGRRKAIHKTTHGVVMSSREASLTRREQTLLDRERELSKRERELERERAGSVVGRHYTGGSTSTASSSTPRDKAGQYATLRRTPGNNSQTQSEHAKLMVDSLNMFESQLSKLTPVLGSSAGTTHAELLSRNAQSLVVNAERLNAMLKAGNSRALDAQVEAEVENDYIPTNPPPSPSKHSSLVDVWRKIGGEYREGLRVSDDLVRAVTGLLLGVGRVMKEYVHLQNGGGSSYGGSEVGSNFGGTPRESPLVHGRSISVGEDDVRSASRGGGVASPDGGRTSRRSWEPLPAGNPGGGGGNNAHASGHPTLSAGSREEALRRLAGVRPDSPLTRASPAFQAVRELDRLETSSPGIGGGLGLPKVNIPPVRRLFSPSQQREMAIVHATSTGNSPAGGGEEYAGYEPSPTPLSRTRGGGGELNVPAQHHERRLYRSPLQTAQEVPLERNRSVTLPPSAQTTTYETPLRGLASGRLSRTSMTLGNDDDDRGGEAVSRQERRRISVASIATIRAAGSSSPLASSDSLTPISTSSERSGSSHHPIPHHASGFFARPSGATTAVTLDNGMVSSPISLTRTDSGATSTTTNTTDSFATASTTTTHSSHASGGKISTSSANTSSVISPTKPTFSRLELGGLSGLQQQLEGYKKRMESESGGAHLVDQGVNGGGGTTRKRRLGASGVNNSSVMITPDSEREMRRKTYGLRSGGGRGSLESNVEEGRRRGESNTSVVDLSVSPNTAAAGALRRERRRAVTDIWSKG